MNRSVIKQISTKKFAKPIIVIVAIILVIIVGYNIYNGIRNARPSNTNLVINNNNVTSRLKKDLIIEDDVIYVAKEDVKNFFDKYIYEDSSVNKLITTYEKKVAALEENNNIVEINGANKKISATLKKANDTVYLPMSELNDVYNVEIKYIDSTNIVTMDSLDRAQTKAYATGNIKIKDKPTTFSRSIEKVKKGDWVIYASDSDNGWAKVRTQDGKVGYVKKSKLNNFESVREDMPEESQIEGKVNMVWDYFSEYHQAPNRKGTSIDGVNAVSPAFFYLTADGKFKENIGSKGEAYIEWAKSNGYKVWPMVISNTSDGIDTRSEVLNDYNKRQKLIETIVDACVKYKLDGINIDFEYIYEKDKDVFSRFVIELTPRMQEVGLVTTIDVTAPDGGANWSMCFDRNVIGDVADYIVFMAYDQNTGKKVGTTAGYNWVETNLKKFIETDEIKSEKIVLALPLYTKLWTITGDEVSSKNIDMNEIDKTLPSGVERKWQEDQKQDYVEYEEKGSTKKMWIEDAKSIKEKVSLVSKYNLGGVAEWTKDRETNDIWQVIKDGLEQ